MRKGSTIDLSQLPPPALIEALDAEGIVAAAIADYRGRYPGFTAVLESEPVVKFIEVLAARETALRNKVNHNSRAVLLAFAIGSDLDHIGARFGVRRMRVPPTDTTPEIVEDDERYRRRIQLAPEAFSVAGPVGAYEYYALSADLSIADVHAFAPMPDGPARGEMHVVVAGRNGQPISDAVITRLMRIFAEEDIVPATDIVNVRRALVRGYAVGGTIYVARGPDPAILKTQAETKLQSYAAERYRIGAEVFHAGLVAAAKVPGVENVSLTPEADVVCAQDEIPHLTELALGDPVVV